jgi:hypothetical protein
MAPAVETRHKHTPVPLFSQHLMPGSGQTECRQALNSFSLWSQKRKLVEAELCTAMEKYLDANAVVFDPEAIRVLTAAFDAAWLSVERSGVAFASDGQSEEARERLAMHIIAEARSGERDQCLLRDGALLRLTQSNSTSAQRLQAD